MTTGKTQVRSSRIPTWWIWGALLLGLIMNAWSLAPKIPFFSDDLLQVPWTKATPIWAFWSQAGPYGDYRPLHYLIWKLIYLLTGNLTPEVLHPLTMFGHLVCVVLVVVLVLTANWRGKDISKLTAAQIPIILFFSAIGFFGFFPFSFDVIFWPSAFSYPLALGLTLGALLIYRVAHRRNSTLLHILALFLILLAGFAHEGAVVAGPALFLYAALLAEPYLQRNRRDWIWPLAAVAVSLIPLFCISRFAGEVPHQFFTGLHPGYSFVVLIQTLTFPIAWLIVPLSKSTGLDAILLMTVIGLLTLIGLGWRLYRQKNFRIYLFGMGWAILWSAIPIATQAFNWYRDPPRVFYPVAVSAALLWGFAFFHSNPDENRPRLPQVLWQSALLIGLLLPGSWFLFKESQIYEQAGDLLSDTLDYANHPTLFINLPGRMTFKERTYPLGHEGVIPLPPPTTIDMFVQAHGGDSEMAVGKARGDLLPENIPFTIEPSGEAPTADDLRRATEIEMATYAPNNLFPLNSPGRLDSLRTDPPIQPDTHIEARFGNAIELSYVSCAYLDPIKDSSVLRLHWRMIAHAGSVKPFIHIREHGEIVAQADGDPLYNLFPFDQWQPGEEVSEDRKLAPLPQGPYSITIGIWNPQTGERLPAVDNQGNPLPDNAYTLNCP